MNPWLALLMSLAVILSTGSLEGLVPADHEDHCDTPVSGHSHGDVDDHHDTPDSPCHHHDVHCCCTHSPVQYQESVATGVSFSCEIVRPESDKVAASWDLCLILHVPIV